MEAKRIVGWNLRKLRVERGLSQERLALEAKIDRAYAGRIERGQENVTITVLEALALALDVPIARLFFEPEPGAGLPEALKPGRKRQR